MSSPVSAPSRNRLLLATLGSLIVALILLVLVVLPAGYGVDPTGFGRATGLTAMAQPPTRTIVLSDVIGGNQGLREVTIPEVGDPTPLPNPAVFQDQPEPARS